ncbi:MAG: glucose-6-phosphate dehydrogenase assembly protein OpcA [Candidatus Dormibacter sp.]
MTTVGALEVAHASGLHAVNRALNDMHHEMLRVGGESEGAVVRLAVLNLVAASVDVDSADLAIRALGRLGAKHPVRAIIVIADPDGTSQMEADVSLQCSAVDSAQVCAEQVRMVVGGEAAYHLASVVTPLLVPDIPTYLWLVGSPPLQQAFGQDAVAICERLIVDSGAYDDDAGALRLLADELEVVGDALAVSDIAWERTRTWRQLIAQSFDGQAMRRFLHGVTRVQVECSGDRVSAQAWLLAGWMASRLGWEAASDQPRVVTTSRPVEDVPASNLAQVTLQCTARGQSALVTVKRRGAALCGVIDVEGGIHAERAVPVSDVDSVDMVGSLLESSAEDPVYRAALRKAADLATAAR